MKLLCSILILAGVFALNDASISFEDEMRVAKDQMMMEDLQRMAMNRDLNSAECSQILLDNLREILGIYNEGLDKCNKTKEEQMEAIKEETTKAINLFSNKMQNTCENLSKCASMESGYESLSCYNQQSSQSAKDCTNVSNDASSEKVAMQAKIETCEGDEKICKTNCYSVYSRDSMKYNNDFYECVNGKQSGSGGGGEKPSEPKITEAPKEPSSSPSGEEDEGQAENGGRRPKSANKHNRF